MKAVFKAWAIDTCSGEGHGFVGRYWWFPKHSEIPEHMEGCRVALFETRDIARENIVHVRGAFPKAKAVSVTVTVESSE